MRLHGRSCTIILHQLSPNHDRGITLFDGVLELAGGSVFVRRDVPKLIPEARQLHSHRTRPPDWRYLTTLVRVAPHLIERIKPVTAELREAFENELETELYLDAYYNGRSRLRTLGWDAVLAESTANPGVE